MIDSLLISLSNSKLFSGCIMLLTNIGGKYLALDMPVNVEKLFSNYSILRYLVIFSIFFMATRDVKISLVLSLLFFIVVYFFINEKSSFCFIKEDTTKNKITKEEFMRAQELINKYNNDNKIHA
jgi:uncharacterized membrane protein